MEKPNHSRFKIIFFFAATVLIVLSILFYLRIDYLLKANEAVVRVNNIKFRLESSLTQYTELESAFRGYMLSRDSVFIASYLHRFALLKENLDALDSFAIRNADQWQDAKTLRIKMFKKVDFMDSTLLESITRDIPANRWLVGKQLTDQVARLVLNMEDELDKETHAKTAIITIKDLLTPLYTIILILGSILILVAIYFKIMKELHTADKLRSSLEESKRELLHTNQSLIQKSEGREKRATELFNINKELSFQNDEKEKRAAELILANIELAFQSEEKEKRAAELIIANAELAFQNIEKEKRTAELSLANKELAFQSDEKEDRAAEFMIANRELVFHNEEKEKRAAELIVANKELAFQNIEKEKRAAELALANKELAFQNEEKEKRAAELIIANKELALQNEEKENRAAELIIANKELAFQNKEKEKRAAELIIANKELALQNEEKEKRAAELIIANKGLAFQNEEKENRAAELILSNKELAFQNEEKEKRAAELIQANKELESFTYISSHDLQEPLRQIQTFASRIISKETELSDKGKDYFARIQQAANRMQTLIADLLAYSRINTSERKFEKSNLNDLVTQVIEEFEEIIEDKKAIIDIGEMGVYYVIPFQIRQMLHNLLGNSLKFSKPGIPPHITISSTTTKLHTLIHPDIPPQIEYCHIRISDNGMGFDPEYKNIIFEVFQRLHDKQKIPGTGIGLAIVKKIVENHSGFISTTSVLGQGATFDVYFPIHI